MDQIKAAVDDLIEETCLRHLNDDQIEWRLRKFTEICERTIESRVNNVGKRKMLIDRLEILKCFYDHSSVSRAGGNLPAREADIRERYRRLQNIVRRRRMALEMIERTDPEVADEIQENLEKLFSRPNHAAPSKSERAGLDTEYPEYARLSPHHWYFLYFNIFLFICLVGAILLVVR